MGTLLYDGTCNLCNGLVRFIRRMDKMNRICFVSIQSEEGTQLLMSSYLPAEGLDSAVYITGAGIYLRSTAVLNILKDLGGKWKLLYVFIIIPPFIRDFIYGIIASNRHRFSKNRDSC